MIEVKVLRVDADERKIGLSRKRVEWAEEAEPTRRRPRRAKRRPAVSAARRAQGRRGRRLGPADPAPPAGCRSTGKSRAEAAQEATPKPRLADSTEDDRCREPSARAGFVKLARIL